MAQKIHLGRSSKSITTFFRDNAKAYVNKLFLEFHGPSTILLQTRAARLNDVLTSHDVNEIAEAPSGSVRKSLLAKERMDTADISLQKGDSQAIQTKPAQMSTASIGPDGKVVFRKEGSGS